MKQIFYLSILTLILLFFKTQTEGKTADKTSAITLPINSMSKQQTNIYIKDKSQYDQIFIDGLSGYNETISLIDNYIITGKDTTYFPIELPLNKVTVFKGTKGNCKYLLTVKRTNLTNLTYNYKLTDKNDKTLDTKSGKSVLGSMFFLASEMDEDSQTGEGYASYEYWDKTTDCWFAIRIGYGKDEKGKQRAMLTYGCEDKNKQRLKLEECPTLRAE